MAPKRKRSKHVPMIPASRKLKRLIDPDEDEEPTAVSLVQLPTDVWLSLARWLTFRDKYQLSRVSRSLRTRMRQVCRSTIRFLAVRVAGSSGSGDTGEDGVVTEHNGQECGVIERGEEADNENDDDDEAVGDGIVDGDDGDHECGDLGKSKCCRQELFCPCPEMVPELDRFCHRCFSVFNHMLSEVVSTEGGQTSSTVDWVQINIKPTSTQDRFKKQIRTRCSEHARLAMSTADGLVASILDWMGPNFEGLWVTDGDQNKPPIDRMIQWSYIGSLTMTKMMEMGFHMKLLGRIDLNFPSSRVQREKKLLRRLFRCMCPQLVGLSIVMQKGCLHGSAKPGETREDTRMIIAISRTASKLVAIEICDCSYDHDDTNEAVASRRMCCLGTYEVLLKRCRFVTVSFGLFIIHVNVSQLLEMDLGVFCMNMATLAFCCEVKSVRPRFNLRGLVFWGDSSLYLMGIGWASYENMDCAMVDHLQVPFQGHPCLAVHLSQFPKDLSFSDSMKFWDWVPHGVNSTHVVNKFTLVSTDGIFRAAFASDIIGVFHYISPTIRQLDLTLGERGFRKAVDSVRKRGPGADLVFPNLTHLVLFCPNSDGTSSAGAGSCDSPNFAIRALKLFCRDPKSLQFIGVYFPVGPKLCQFVIPFFRPSGHAKIVGWPRKKLTICGVFGTAEDRDFIDRSVEHRRFEEDCLAPIGWTAEWDHQGELKRGVLCAEQGGEGREIEFCRGWVDDCLHSKCVSRHYRAC